MPEQPDRLEREIDEILNKIEQFPTQKRPATQPVRNSIRRLGNTFFSRQHAVIRELSRVSLSQLVLLSFLLILGAFMIRGIGPIGPWMMIAGVVMLVTSLALMLFGSSNSKSQSHQWRGRTIYYETDNLSQKIRRWFRFRRSR